MNNEQNPTPEQNQNKDGLTTESSSRHLEHEVRQTAWIDVNKCLPNFEHVIVLVESGDPSDEKYYDRRVDIAYYNTDNKAWGCFYLHDWAGGKITHWMPLPPMPERGSA